jgi:polyhydroxyalkanoate synthesis regulator phasin
VARLRLPFARRAKRSAEGQPSSSATGEHATTEKPSGGAGAAIPEAPTTPAERADPQERIDGLRAWVAQIDRKLGVRSYAGAAIAVLALAAAAVGLVLTLTLKQDAATDDDVRSLRDQISVVEQSASQAAAQEEDVQALERRLTDLEAEVNKISSGQTTARRELKVVQDDIKELRDQVSQAGTSSSNAGSQGSQGAQGGAQGSSP